MDKKELGILGFLFLLLIVLIYLLFRTGAGEKSKPAPGAPLVETQPQPKDMEKGKKVTLFFLSEEDSLLHPEEREIAGRSSTAEEAQEVIDELIKGPRSELISSLPPETKLRQLFVTKDGMAYVDFSKEIMEKHPSGSSAELSTVYCVVNSLTYNFPSLKRVFVLVEGGERETLDGHIDLSKPFLPDYTLIAK